MIEIIIEKLFGRFDYKFSLKYGELTILSGPNGFGKTTLLNALNAVVNSDMLFFYDLKFERFEIKKKEEKLLIKKKAEGLLINDYELTLDDIRYMSHGREIRSTSMNLHKSNEVMIRREKYQNLLEQMKAIVGDAELIPAQRLLKVNTRRNARLRETNKIFDVEYIEKISELPDKLLTKIKEVNEKYFLISTGLDSNYPERLFKQRIGITEEEFNAYMKEMHEKVVKANENEIFKLQELQNVTFRSEDARALKVYFEDFDKKYNVYESLLDCLDLFKNVVNKRFKFKHLEYSNARGFVVEDEEKRRIPLEKLSSGEQETIILFYYFLFEIPDETLILLDEPETSLHVAWQKMFIKDLKEIAKVKKFMVLLATHSPQIVSGNRDLQVDLGEIYKDGFN